MLKHEYTYKDHQAFGVANNMTETHNNQKMNIECVDNRHCVFKITPFQRDLKRQDAKKGNNQNTRSIVGN